MSTDYCSIYFGKSLSQIEYTDIQSFFQNERSESDQIEFKSITPNGKLDQKIPKLREAICAFLNSQGGILIWGSPEGIKINGRKEKVFKGKLTPLPKTIEQDWLISKISDAIVPLPNQIKCNILENQGKCICVFEIQESEFSPHQTNDKYFMRIDGQTRVAPHHYVEALMKRIRYPNIEAYLKITEFTIFQRQTLLLGKYQLNISLIFYNWSSLQNEEDFSFRLNTTYGTFYEYALYAKSSNHRLKGTEYFHDPAKKRFHYGEPIVYDLTIMYDPEILKIKNYLDQIFVHFAGKFSPMKSSEYILDLSILNGNPSEIIKKKEENKLMADVHEEKDMNREKLIDHFYNN